MTRQRILSTIRAADPGSDEFLTAVGWLVKRAMRGRESWQTVDDALEKRERQIAADQYYKKSHRPWLGPRGVEEAA